MNIKKGDKTLASNEIICNIYEYPTACKNIEDSLVIKNGKIKDFINESVKESVKRLNKELKSIAYWLPEHLVKKLRRKSSSIM